MTLWHGMNPLGTTLRYISHTSHLQTHMPVRGGQLLRLALQECIVLILQLYNIITLVHIIIVLVYYRVLVVLFCCETAED